VNVVAKQAGNQLKDTVSDTAGKAGSAAQSVKGAVPSGQLGDSLRSLAGTVTTRAVESLTDKIGSASGRLTDFADSGGGGGLVSALTGGASGVKRKAMLGAVKGGLSGVADKVKGGAQDLAGSLTGGKSRKGKDKLKVTNIIESVDVGVPVDLAYDLWTRFTDFPSFMKKVENVEQESDEKLVWKAQVFWSHRTWEATILEQVPGERIVWRSKGAKGHVDGAVTFHELTPDLTRIVLVLEYHPQGFFERTGNIWRAQGRRARLELKHFARHAMTQAVLHQDDIEGWRGEIRDGQVVDQGEEEGEESEEPGEAGDEDRAQEDQGNEDESEESDQAEESEEAEEPEEDEAEFDEDEEEPEEAEEPEEESETPRRRTARAGSGRAGGGRR